MKKLLTLLLLGAGGLLQAHADGDIQADTQQLVNVDVAARFDWQNTSYDGHNDHDATGFRAKYVALRVDGYILPNLSYSWRQRISRPGGGGGFLDPADWLYINWDINDRFSLSGGKEIVAIGGYEYDRPPIDIFQGSLFWNNIGCYEIGMSGKYRFSGRDALTLQVTQSPFSHSGNRDVYSYNLMWSGSHGCWSTLWSANLSETHKGHYLSMLALGNQFKGGPLTLQLDFLNRAAGGQTFLFKDCSVVADLACDITDRWRAFAKYTYDVNRSGTDCDPVVLDGTELNMAGAGVEFFPIKNARHALRVHANCFYAWGHNANEADMMQSKTLVVDLGLTWDMNLFSLKRK